MRREEKMEELVSLKVNLCTLKEAVLLCLIFGIPRIINFPFGTNGKLIILGVPILKHLRVFVMFAVGGRLHA